MKMATMEKRVDKLEAFVEPPAVNPFRILCSHWGSYWGDKPLPAPKKGEFVMVHRCPECLAKYQERGKA